MKSDIRFALRMLLKHRWFSAAVIATIALGIGVNTTVFTLVNAVLYKPVPLPRGERLVVISGQDMTDPEDRQRLSFPDFRDYQAAQTSFEAFEGTLSNQAVIGEPGIPPERYNMGLVTPGTFSMLQTLPVLGRPFSPADGAAGAETVVLLGHRMWQTRYAGSPGVIGRTIRLNEEPATIIGVMPEDFKFPSDQEIWKPLTLTEQLEKRDRRPITGFGLLKPGVSIDQAQQDLSVIAQRLMQDFPEENENRTVIVQTFHSAFNGGEIRIVFLMMLGAVGFVLLIACANIANMLLGRALTRSREISIRAALGASRPQVIRQLLTESVLLSCIGGLCGLVLSVVGVRLFDQATQDVGKPYWIEFSMDWRAFVYFALISISSGIIFGLMPALRASRVDLNSALKEGTAAAGTASGGGLTGILVVLQFALTVVLLAGAGVMMRSFFAVQSVNPHIPADQIFVGRLYPPEGEGLRYQSDEVRRQFYRDLQARFARTPGVEQVAFASHLPGLGSSQRSIEIDGRPVEDPQNRPRASLMVLTPGYFEMVDLPLLQGRYFEERDGQSGREAAVVTREFAERYWPETSPIGERFRFHHEDEPSAWLEVIGVSADIEQRMNGDPAPPLVFVPHEQEPWSWMSLLVRTSNDPIAFAPTARQILQEADQDLPLFDTNSLAGAVKQNMWFLQVFGSLFLSFALIALLMASVGIYGVVAQSTARRSREIGIRMALGATTGKVMRLVVGRGMGQLIIGLVLGLAGAAAATGLLEKVGFLVGISPHDPVTFAAVTIILMSIGLTACWLPARRASRINPVQALRHD